MKLFSQKAAFCHTISAPFSLSLSRPALNFLSLSSSILSHFYPSIYVSSVHSHSFLIEYSFISLFMSSHTNQRQNFSSFLNFNKQTNFLFLHFETFQRVVSEKERKETKEKEGRKYERSGRSKH